MLRLLKEVFVLLFVSLLSFHALAEESKPTRIAMAFDGQWEDAHEIFEMVKAEILALTENEFEIQISKEDLYVSDWTQQGNKKMLDKVYAMDDVDLVLVVGVVSTNDIIHRPVVLKPTVATLVLDKSLQKAPLTEGNVSGVPNLSYTAFSNTFAESLDKYYNIVPFKKLAFIVNRHVVAAIPALKKQTRKYLKQKGIEIEFISIEDSIDEALHQISEDVDAVVVAPQSYLSSKEIRSLADGLIARKLPSLAITGKKDVELGLLVSLTQEELDYIRISRRIALNVQSILLGDDPSTLPVFIEETPRITMNMATARAIGFSPSWDVISEADFLYREDSDLETLTIEQAVREAVNKNLSIAAQVKSVSGNYQEVWQAWARLLPQVKLSHQYTLIDKDRAKAGLGSAPERTATVGASISQVLYSNETFGNISIQRSLHRSREEALSDLKLDIALNTAVAFLNVLKTKNLEKIQRDNLNISKENLRLARSREEVGHSGPADVYRWESEIATNRQQVIRATEDHDNARIQLNRLLHRPLEQSNQLVEPKYDGAFFLMDGERTEALVQNPRTFRIFRDFFVKEAVANTPEIKELDAQIQAQEKRVKVAGAKLWQPEVSASLDFTENYNQAGDGLPTTLTKDDHDRTFGIQATFPLFEGGSNLSKKRQEADILKQLELEREAKIEEIGEQLRTSIRSTGASYESIELSMEAAETARKNLELIKESYSEGTVNIIDLIDAQNALLNADLVAENAAFDFMIDMMEVQNGLGYYFFMLSSEEQEEWYQRYENYFKDQTAKV